MISLHDRFKVVDESFGVRKSVRSVPRTFSMQLFDQNVYYKKNVGKGDTFYSHEDHKDNTRKEDNVWKKESFVFMEGVDDEGNTCTLRVTGIPFKIYVQCPDEFSSTDMNKLRDRIAEKLGVAVKEVSFSQQHYYHFCGWEPCSKDPTKAKLYNYCVLGFTYHGFCWTVTTMFEKKEFLGTFPQAKFEVHESKNGSTQKILEACADASLAKEESTIKPGGWIEITRWSIPQQYYSHSQVEVQVDYKNIKPLPQKITTAPYWTASWDIECKSKDGNFPLPQKEEDHTICINTYLYQHGTGKSLQVCHHYGRVDPVEDVLVVECAQEIDVIEQWRDMIVLSVQPTVLEGYNVDGFDWNWIAKKAKILNLEYTTETNPSSRLFRLGTLCDVVENVCEKNLSSAAKGSSVLNWIPTFGRINLDVYRIIKDDYKLHSYKLKTVCEYFFALHEDRDEPKNRVFNALKESVGKFVTLEYLIYNCTLTEEQCRKAIVQLCGDHGYTIEQRESTFMLVSHTSSLRKIDLTPKEIWSNYDAGPSKRSINVSYAARDCVMPKKLEEKLNLVTSLLEMSKTTYTPMNTSLMSGQQARIKNLLHQYCHYYGYIINVKSRSTNSSSDDVKYKGACVLDPLNGFYKDPIATLDFSSLYPSILMQNNLCYSTLIVENYIKNQLQNLCTPVKEAKLDFYNTLSEYKNKKLCVSGNEVTTSCRYSNEEGTIAYKEFHPTKGNTYSFVQHTKGVCPRILSALKLKRKEVRRIQETYPKDSLEAMVLDKKQLNIKLVMNSIYGFFGFLSGDFVCKPLAESVTCEGREMIMMTKLYAERYFTQYTSNDFVDSLNRDIEDQSKHYKYIPLYVKETIGGKVRVVYGDTDSVMVLFENIDLLDNPIHWCLTLAKLASLYITSKFCLLDGTNHISLELEKCYRPFLLLTKKNYAGVIYTQPDKPDRRDDKGLPSKRRDSWFGLQNTYKESLENILIHMDLDKAKRCIMGLLQSIEKNELDLSQYVQSKCLKSDYSLAKSQPPHVVVRNKIRGRNPGSEPKSGDRVPFVIIIDKTLKTIGGRAEDPEWAKDHSQHCVIDRLYYVNSLMKPFIKLLGPIFESPEKLFENAIRNIRNQQEKSINIETFLKRKNDFGPSTQESIFQSVTVKTKLSQETIELPTKKKQKVRKGGKLQPPSGGTALPSWLVVTKK